MKRPLLTASIVIFCCNALFLSAGVKALLLLLPCTVAALIFYFTRKRTHKAPDIIPAVCICIIISSICFYTYQYINVKPDLLYSNTTADISGKVITTPRETSEGTVFTLQTETVGIKNHRTKITITIPYKNQNINLYDFISLEDVSITENTDRFYSGVILEGSGKTYSSLWTCTKTPFYYCLQLKNKVSEQISLYLDGNTAGLLKGMLFGDTEEINSSTLQTFRATGIAHLLAVSGLHTGLWCTVIHSVFKKAGLKPKGRNLLCILFLFGFCTVSAFTPSVVRASLMTGTALTGPFFKRKSDSLNSLCLAICMLILSNPYVCASPSFLLSVTATAGVLFSHKLQEPISDKIPPIKFIKDGAEKLTGNLCISACSGLFTAPVSAYFFRCICLSAPITNILTVTLAFIGLVCGLISTTISFIPLKLTQSTSILLFKATEIILNMVTKIADFIYSFKFSSIPTTPSRIILIFFIALFFISLYHLTKKISKAPIAPKIPLLLCVIAVLIAAATPLTSLSPAHITVHSVGNGANVTLKSGLNYAHLACGASVKNPDTDYLPHSTAEELRFLYISNSESANINTVKQIIETHPPQETVITEYSNDLLQGSTTPLPPQTVISDNHIHKFNNKITIETVDTYRMNCVIIKCNNTVTLVSCNSGNNLQKIFDSYGTPDNLIISGGLPKKLPNKVDTLIISSDTSIISNSNIADLKKQCNKIHFTATDGSITFTGE